MNNSNKPIIGIIIDCSKKTISQGGYANFPWYALRMHYSDVIAKLGGIPILLPYEHNAIGSYLKICNGLLFPGGDTDIHPSAYGEKITVKNINLDPDNPRIKFEFELLNAALKTHIPIFGICAGFQLLNVVLGGNLFQDIKEQVQTNITHIPIPGKASYITHPITVTKGSLLHRITGKINYTVNSFHHQTVKELGKGLQISAVAPDSLIEAIELKNHPFCIGVEWHPEFQKTNEDKELFKAFIYAAKEYSRR